MSKINFEVSRFQHTPMHVLFDFCMQKVMRFMDFISGRRTTQENKKDDSDVPVDMNYDCFFILELL